MTRDATLPTDPGKSPGHEKWGASFVTPADWSDTTFTNSPAAPSAFPQVANPANRNLLRTLVEEHNIACGFVTHNASLISDSDEVVRVRAGHVSRDRALA
ncbi:hypothetical protein [Corynebacterium sp. NML130628]|uniref:hypothetical protein n=1 Tax=Corynebacterium sp. NML130628 TaxID=1906333 RepID=UPI0008FB2E1C|nr:hypothetical protein [Corynebacterium sp. NML130628]OIR46148.1 hypothetical protein BJP07_01625 [Corynebacterium sp. NML130628]